MCVQSSSIIYLPHLLLPVIPGERTVKNFMTDTDDRIKKYETKFQELKLAFQGHAIVQTEITVLRILNTVDNIGA